MRARLLVDRPAYPLYSDSTMHHPILAGSIVDVVKIDGERMIGRYKGFAALNFTVDQAEPIE